MVRVRDTQKAIARSNNSNQRRREKFVAQAAQERQKAIDRWYAEGGLLFLSWAKDNYRMYSGEPLRWDEPFLEEFFILLGNPWAEKVVIEKAAQMGYSEALIALTAFFLGYLRTPIGFGFEEQGKLLDMVGSRIQPALDHCEVIQELLRSQLETTGRAGIDSKKAITVAGVKSSFFYAGTKSSGKSLNFAKRQATSSLSSFSAGCILADEIELWPKGVLDIATQRMAASTMASKPLRAGSTPGHEGGIVDSEIRKAKYLFQWHVTCPYCDREQFIDPFGNFLRPTTVEEDGVQEERYIDPVGKPYKWFFRDANDKIETAYIGCDECEGELTHADIADGAFKCVNTGITLLEFCTKRKVTHSTVALRLPKLASRLFSPSERLRRLVESDNPADEIQQGLGRAISLGGGKINLKRILNCVGLALPDKDAVPDLIVAGIDQGRHGQYTLIQKWYLADHKDKEKRWLFARKEIVDYLLIAEIGDEIDALIDKYNINLIGMDNEPEFHMAASYALKHLPTKLSATSTPRGQVYLCDQVDLKGEQFRRTIRAIKSTRKRETEVPVYLIDRTFALDKVRDRIYRQLAHFPPGLTYEPEPENLLHHYLTSDRLTTGRWVEPPGAPDHWFAADSFCEMAVLASFYEPGMTKKMAFSSIPSDQI